MDCKFDSISSCDFSTTLPHKLIEKSKTSFPIWLNGHPCKPGCDCMWYTKYKSFLVMIKDINIVTRPVTINILLDNVFVP